MDKKELYSLRIKDIIGKSLKNRTDGSGRQNPALLGGSMVVQKNTSLNNSPDNKKKVRQNHIKIQGSSPVNIYDVLKDKKQEEYQLWPKNQIQTGNPTSRDEKHKKRKSKERDHSPKLVVAQLLKNSKIKKDQVIQSNQYQYVDQKFQDRIALNQRQKTMDNIDHSQDNSQIDQTDEKMISSLIFPNNKPKHNSDLNAQTHYNFYSTKHKKKQSKDIPQIAQLLKNIQSLNLRNIKHSISLSQTQNQKNQKKYIKKLPQPLQTKFSNTGQEFYTVQQSPTNKISSKQQQQKESSRMREKYLIEQQQKKRDKSQDNRTMLKNLSVEEIQGQRKHPVFQYYNTNMEMHCRYPNEYDSINQCYRSHFQQSFHSLKYCQKSVREPSIEDVKFENLPPRSEKYKITIVFDLDETLIHCNENAETYQPESNNFVNLSIKFPNGDDIDIQVSIRPYLIFMLERLAQKFELIVFTASHPCYASPIIDLIDPKGLISHRLYQQSCYMGPNDIPIKDLRIFLPQRQLESVLLVDNAAYSYAFQKQNGIPIIPFWGDMRDCELRYLSDYLENFSNFDKNDNVQIFNREWFRLDEYLLFDKIQDALQGIYGIESTGVWNEYNETI